MYVFTYALLNNRVLKCVAQIIQHVFKEKSSDCNADCPPPATPRPAPAKVLLQTASGTNITLQKKVSVWLQYVSRLIFRLTEITNQAEQFPEKQKPDCGLTEPQSGKLQFLRYVITRQCPPSNDNEYLYSVFIKNRTSVYVPYLHMHQ